MSIPYSLVKVIKEIAINVFKTTSGRNQTRPSSLRYPWPCTTLFCTFICWHCTTTKWNFLISRVVRDVNTRIQLQKIGENLTNWTEQNKSKEVWNSENSHFKWRLRHRRRPWLFKLLNEGNRRMENSLYSSGPNTGIGEYNVSAAGYRDVTYMPARSSQSNFWQQLHAEKISKRTKGERGLWEWDCGDLLFRLRTHKEKLRIFFIISCFLTWLDCPYHRAASEKGDLKGINSQFQQREGLELPIYKAQV